MALSWREINARIQEALAGPDPVGDLGRLFERTDDGYVALMLAEHLAQNGRPCEALDWFGRAHQRLPMEGYKKRAADGLARAQRACSEPPPPGPPPPEPPVHRAPGPALHVICCTKRKIWHDNPDAPRYVPAGQAYTGRTFQQWNASQESANGDPWVVLSAKYGFLDPEQPIEDYDVTFNDPGTHPVGDGLLRAQVAARWAAFEGPLTGFRSVKVLGSTGYVDRVRAAFSGTDVEISSWTPPPPPSRVDLGEALAALPDEVFTRAEETLPEWPVLGSIATLPPPLATLAALAVALNNYNLGPGGADQYWSEAQCFIGTTTIGDVATLRARLDLLLSVPVAARDRTDRKQKRARTRRLFESPIPRLLTRRVRRIGLERLWRELAAAPGPSADAKTVVYAIRTVALLHRRATGQAPALPNAMPLPVDMRIAWVTLSSGLLPASPAGAAADMEHDARRIASDRREDITQAWAAVAAVGGRPAMSLDALLWLAARHIYDQRTDRAPAADGVRDLLTDLGADSSAAATAAAALVVALPERSEPPPPPPPTLPPFDLDVVHAEVDAAFGDAVVWGWTEPAKPAKYSALRGDTGTLEPAVRLALFDRVLNGGSLYTHQAGAIEGALDRQEVVIETPTASGKTLCYQVPILDALCRDPTATALYLAPINALVEDQLAAVKRFADCAPIPRVPEEFAVRLMLGNKPVTVARYDGGVPAKGDVRPAIRRALPRLLITNPDMLSRGIIPHHKLWERFFAGLRYVVLDEMHMYRGLFGAHIANVLRRLRRITCAFGASPQVIGCSASIGNPEELFEHLVGRKPGKTIWEKETGAPAHRRRTLVVDTMAMDGGGNRMIPAAADLVAELAGRGDAPTIAFMRSIREVDAVHERVLRTLSQSHPRDDVRSWVRTYKREIPAERKAEIIRDLRNGTTRAVIATTALQMGIDIGSLSVAVIGGFPGRVASLKQSIGRAGRAGGGLAVVLLGSNALDQHYALRPDELDGRPERVNVDPDNREIVRRHVLAAADERRLGRNDHEAFGRATFELVEGLRAAGDLEATPGDWLVPAEKHHGCAPRLDIRTTVGFDCPVRDSRGKVVARPDVARALRHYHPGARFLIDGQAYEVEEFAIHWHCACGYGVARRIEGPGVPTQPVVESSCEVIDVAKAIGGDSSQAGVARGAIRTVARVPAFYRLHAGKAPELVALGPKQLAPYAVRTQGLWFDLPPTLLSGVPEGEAPAALRSAGGALRVAAAVMCQTDTVDVGLHIQMDSSPLRIYLSDIEEGGNGLTATMFGDVAGLLGGALRRLEGCPHCQADPESRGCPKCVTANWGHAGSVYRAGGITVLRRMRQDLALAVGDP